MTSNYLIDKVLTPTASQASMYDTVMLFASMPLQNIHKSSHNLNLNHYNPMPMKESLEKKPTLCPTSNLEQSGDPLDRTSESMNTSGET